MEYKNPTKNKLKSTIYLFVGSKKFKTIFIQHPSSADIRIPHHTLDKNH